MISTYAIGSFELRFRHRPLSGKSTFSRANASYQHLSKCRWRLLEPTSIMADRSRKEREESRAGSFPHQTHPSECRIDRRSPELELQPATLIRWRLSKGPRRPQKCNFPQASAIYAFPKANGDLQPSTGLATGSMPLRIDRPRLRAPSKIARTSKFPTPRSNSPMVHFRSVVVPSMCLRPSSRTVR